MYKIVKISFVFFQVGLLSACVKAPSRLGLKTMATCTVKSLTKDFEDLHFSPLIKDFEEWHFSPLKLASLPIEAINENYVRRDIHDVLFSYVKPTPVTSPKLVVYSKDVITNVLDLDESVTKEKSFVEFVSGNNILNSSNPVAHRYGGHQFGYWAMQLGDGRAILLGEYLNRLGQRWELQLKGSGKTPYSRDGDGRAVLRSSIREFLCSEAMHYLDIPTSRAGALVVSEDTTIRDPLYDGNPVLEKMAVVLRLAPSWFRFGSFELLAKMHENSLLNKLKNFIIKEHFPDIDIEDEDHVLTLFAKVARMTSDLVLAWQAVGFTHGVLNTDNMSILGITIDYGPFGFLEDYDPMYVPNASDTEARYCYIRQVEIIIHNLLRLGEALAPLLTKSQVEKTFEILKLETKYLEKKHTEIFSNKLGLSEPNSDLLTLLVTMLEDTKSDFTMVFREMGELAMDLLDKPCSDTNWALAKLGKHKDYPRFLELYRDLVKKSGITDEQRKKKMCAINPRYILRNWMAQEAIQKAEDGDFIEVKRLLRILSKPYERQEEAESLGFASPPPSWSKNLVLSCSS